MNKHDDDIDVLGQHSATQDKKYVKSADAQVYQPLAAYCVCELMVNEVGMSAIVYNKTLPEGIHWVEYDMDLSILTLVTWSGGIMELGLKIHPPFKKYLKMAEQLMLIQMTEDKNEIVVMYPADIVIRNIGI